MLAIEAIALTDEHGHRGVLTWSGGALAAPSVHTEPERAARLLGAMLEPDQIGGEAPPYEGALLERTYGKLVAVLGQERFEAALEEGRRAGLQKFAPESPEDATSAQIAERADLSVQEVEQFVAGWIVRPTETSDPTAPPTDARGRTR